MKSRGNLYYALFESRGHFEFDDISKKIIFDNIISMGKESYHLFTLLILPKQVHLIIQTKDFIKGNHNNPDKILRPIKNITSNHIIKYLNTNEITAFTPGALDNVLNYNSLLIPKNVFKQQIYCHKIRSEEEIAIKFNYILNNPDNVELAELSYDYKWIYFE